MKHILFVDAVHAELPSILAEHGFTFDFMTGQPLNEVLNCGQRYMGLVVRSRFHIDHAFLESFPKLEFIARVGAGMDNIDVVAADERGIICLNAPEGNRDAVGEHTLGLLLALINKIPRADRQVRTGKWQREENRGTEIMGKVVGIIGYGNMGSAFARRLKGFDANVISYDKYKNGYSDGNTVEMSMQDLFVRSDIVSLHVPLTEETHHLAGDRFFDSFDKPIWFINTSRGGVVDAAALARALKSGRVRGAALDVLELENSGFEREYPSLPDDLRYLLGSEDVVITPHVAGWTVESEIKLARVLAEKIIALSLRHKS